MVKLANLLSIRNIEQDVEGASPKAIHDKRKALEQSLREGTAGSFSQGIASTYISPFALALKATDFQIGLLSAVSGLVMPLSELVGSKMMLTQSRKKIVLKFILLQALTWIPLAFLTFLLWKGLFLSYLPIALISLYALFVAWEGLATPAWFSWMGDIVPEKDRGKYFSIRSIFTNSIGLLAVLIGAIILDLFETRGFATIGFTIIFTLAFFSRTISWIFFRKQYVPKFRVRKRSYIGFRRFLKTPGNYRRFALYQGFLYFSLMIASPFFTIYMLQELGYSKLMFGAVIISSTVFHIIFNPLVGRFADRFGNLRTLWIANICFVLTPLPWLVFQNPIALILIPQAIAGLANAALIISGGNFTYDNIDSQHRGQFIAYSTLLLGIGTFIGSIAGGALLQALSNATFNRFFFIFILASGTRLLVGLIFLPRIKEVRQTENLPPHNISFIHPFRTLSSEITWLKTIFREK